jgi:hypothetical protein
MQSVDSQLQTSVFRQNWILSTSMIRLKQSAVCLVHAHQGFWLAHHNSDTVKYITQLKLWVEGHFIIFLNAWRSCRPCKLHSNGRLKDDTLMSLNGPQPIHISYTVLNYTENWDNKWNMELRSVKEKQKFKTSVLKMEAVGDLRSSLHASWRQQEHITSGHLPLWRQKQQVTQERSLLTP